MPETEKKEPEAPVEFFDINKVPLKMTVKEAAGLARVSPLTIYRWVEIGFIPHERLGGLPERAKDGRRRNSSIRIPKDEFLAWLASFGKEGRKRREKVNQYA